MPPSRGILRPASSLGLARTVLRGSSARVPLPLIERAGARQFGTSLYGSGSGSGSVLRGIAEPNALAGRSISGALPLGTAFALRSLPFPARQTRYASTQQPPAPPVIPETETTTPPASEWSTTADLTSNLDLSTSDLFNVPEQIGYLKALGLDYGWGPTTMMQWVLEHVYIYTGLPWWASLGVVAVLIRAAMFMPALSANDTTQRMQQLRADGRYAEATARFQQAAYMSRDQQAMMAARREMKMIEMANGVRQWKLFVPLIQLPITLGAFRLLRGMTALPVPSLETGGLWWFTDLTVADPYFVLPILSSVFLYGIMRMGLPYMAPQQRRIMGVMSMVLIPVGGLVTLYMPAGIQVFFVFTGILQYLQSWAFYQPWLRRLFGLGPVHKFDALASPASTARTPVPTPGSGGSWQAPRMQAQSSSSDESLFGTARSSISWVREKLAENSAKTENKMAATKAQEYEHRRALQEQEEWRARVQEKRTRKRKE